MNKSSMLEIYEVKIYKLQKFYQSIGLIWISIIVGAKNKTYSMG